MCLDDTGVSRGRAFMIGLRSASTRLSVAVEASIRRHLTVTLRLVLLLGVCVAVLAALFLFRAYVVVMGPVLAFAGFALATLFSLIANGVVARSIVLPLKRTIGYCEAIGNFRYDSPIDLSWPDEIGDVMRALDRMQRRLGENEAALRTLSGATEHSPASVVITDRAGTITYVNPKFSAVTGYSAAEAIGQNLRILNSGRQSPTFPAELWASLGAGHEWHGEFANRRKNGEIYWERASISSILDSRGDITHFVAVKEDITQKRQADEALRQSEERFDLAMRATTHGVWDWNLETNEIYYSARWKEILGYADPELEDRLETFDRLIHPDDKDRALAAIRAYLDGAADRYEIEIRMRHKHGHYVDVKTRGFAARTPDGRAERLVGTHVDITERKRAEKARLQAEQKYRDIVEQSIQGVYQTAPDGRFLSANAALARLFGYESPGELLDKPAGAASEFYIDGDRRAEFARLVEQQGTVSQFEARVRRKDGRIIWTAENARAVRDSSGQLLYYEGFVEDITVRKETEQLRSDFVSFVTHQLRTPLSGIRWMLELAAELELSEEASSYVSDARESAERLIGLVNDLLDVARLESGKLVAVPRPTDLKALTEGIVGELMSLVREKQHELSVTSTESPTLVLVDPQLGRQVVLNLLSNAIKYTPPSGTITVQMRRADGSLEWSVRDNGIGISEAGQRRLFEKFYRADNARTVDTEGTGLGLYLVRLIIERSQGRIWCESEEGVGTTFRFTLPLTDQAAGAASG